MKLIGHIQLSLVWNENPIICRAYVVLENVYDGIAQACATLERNANPGNALNIARMIHDNRETAKGNPGVAASNNEVIEAHRRARLAERARLERERWREYLEDCSSSELPDEDEPSM